MEKESKMEIKRKKMSHKTHQPSRYIETERERDRKKGKDSERETERE